MPRKKKVDEAKPAKKAVIKDLETKEGPKGGPNRRIGLDHIGNVKGRAWDGDYGFDGVG